MNVRDMNDDQYGTFFAVCRSVRYHDRRRAFFELLHRGSAGLTVLLAGSVLFDLARPGESASWMTCLAVVAALLASFDIVIGYASRANAHIDLKRRFGELEMAIIEGGDDEETWKKHQLKRLQIEQNEPPIFRALDVLCHNELLRAQGIDRDGEGKTTLKQVSRLQEWTCHFWYWGNMKLESQQNK